MPRMLLCVTPAPAGCLVSLHATSLCGVSLQAYGRLLSIARSQQRGRFLRITAEIARNIVDVRPEDCCAGACWNASVQCSRPWTTRSFSGIKLDRQQAAADDLRPKRWLVSPSVSGSHCLLNRSRCGHFLLRSEGRVRRGVAPTSASSPSSLWNNQNAADHPRIFHSPVPRIGQNIPRKLTFSPKAYCVLRTGQLVLHSSPLAIFAYRTLKYRSGRRTKINRFTENERVGA